VTPALDHIRVHDAMHQGIFGCGPEAPLAEVAAIMAKHRVHAVAVTDGERSRPAAVVSDLDVVTAIASRRDPSAAQSAATEPLTVSADERLDRAAQLMVEHGVAHLVVVDDADGHPIGVLSTLDIVAVFAGE
jgi:CBS domain-containing protein